MKLTVPGAALCLGLAAALAAPAARAVLPPCAQDEYVRSATDVIQMTVKTVLVPPGHEDMDIARCAVSGTIVRVFRGNLKVGDEITLDIVCHSNLVGGTMYMPPKALRQAKALEVHLSEGAPIQLGQGILTLAAPTDEMVYEPFCDEDGRKIR